MLTQNFPFSCRVLSRRWDLRRMRTKCNYGRSFLMWWLPFSRVHFSPYPLNYYRIYTDPRIAVAVAFTSDHLKVRGALMLIILPIAIIGYAVIANISTPMVKYGMTFLMATGMYGSVPCILVWNSNNSAGHYKRATTSAVQLAIANCAGFVASKTQCFLSRSRTQQALHKLTL